jgi:hypothetical protein
VAVDSAVLEAVEKAVNKARYARDEFPEVTLLNGATVDLTVAVAAAVGTVLDADWAAVAWIAVGVLAGKTLVQTFVAILSDRGVT